MFAKNKIKKNKWKGFDERDRNKNLPKTRINICFPNFKNKSKHKLDGVVSIPVRILLCTVLSFFIFIIQF